MRTPGDNHGVTPPIPRWLSGTLTSVALVAAVTAVIALLEPRVPALGLGVLYLCAVVPVALRYGAAAAAAVSVASMVVFTFFFLPPRYNLDPGTSERWEVLLAFLASSLVVGVLTARSQREARRSRQLADEQAALRRVATLVARGVPPSEVFAAVAREVGLLLGVDATHMARYEPDGTATAVAAWSSAGDHVPVGTRVDLEGESVAGLVSRTGQPARMSGYEHATGPGAAMGRELGLRSSVGAPIVVDQSLWGVMIASSKRDGGLPVATESRIAAFTELLATAIANAESRAGLARLAEEQAALRRVATLVARGTPPEELFAAVVEEVGRVLPAENMGMARFESDGTMTTVAISSGLGDRFPVGGRWPLGGKNVSTIVFETGRSARIDDYDDASGRLGVAMRERGLRSSVGAPIVVEGRVWGVLTTTSMEQPLPADTEARVASFAKLVATAIANAESRAELARLADEQAALRRVATLVARGTPPEEVFAAVTDEVGQMLGTDLSGMARYESDDTCTVLATWAAEGEHGGAHPLVPGPWPLDGGDLASTVWSTGRSVRIDDYRGVPGRIAAFVRDELGIGSSVGGPIVVEGRLWGVLFVHSKQTHQLPRDTEARVTGFTELVATAIANAESRTELTASRARVVAAADGTRKQIERDLHDGIQQRLISLGLELRAARAAVPRQLSEFDDELSRVADGLASASDELREISRGIHPAIISEGGLEPALRTLCRRSAVPVHLDLHAGRRFPERVEVAAYYVVSEALTNAAKHAHPSVVNLELGTHDTTLQLAIRDDGIGGADPDLGSGLVGLRDRIEALGGTLQVTSPSGIGTTLTIEVPLEGQDIATPSAP